MKGFLEIPNDLFFKICTLLFNESSSDSLLNLTRTCKLFHYRFHNNVCSWWWHFVLEHLDYLHSNTTCIRYDKEKRKLLLYWFQSSISFLGVTNVTKIY